VEAMDEADYQEWLAEAYDEYAKSDAGLDIAEAQIDTTR